MSWFGPSPAVEVKILTSAGRKVRKNLDGSPPLPIFSNGEDVPCEAVVVIPQGKRLDHVGVKAELKGVVETYGEKGGQYEFTASVRELAVPGAINGEAKYSFVFKGTDMRFESYEGLNAMCRYFVRVTVTRSGFSASNLVKEAEFVVRNALEKPPADAIVTAGDGTVEGPAVKLEVGIEECLHIEFEYDKAAYHTEEVLTGRVNFLKVSIRIKYMEIALIRRETVGQVLPGMPCAPGNTQTESETLTRHEIMDGCPVKGERIPIRLHLGALGQILSPSYPAVANSFQVRYFLNLVLVDEEDRRYFKQQEITLWRKTIADEIRQEIIEP